MVLALGVKASDLPTRNLVRSITALTVPFSKIPKAPLTPFSTQRSAGDLTTLAFLARYARLSIPGSITIELGHPAPVTTAPTPSASPGTPHIYLLRDVASIPSAASHIITKRLAAWVAMESRLHVDCLLLRLEQPITNIYHSHGDVTIAATPALGADALRHLSKLEL